jgi:spastin
VLAEVLDKSPPVEWDAIAGLATAKQALQEAVIYPALRPDIYKGLRAPVRGILLYGPPGNGKTLLGRALAHASRSTFFSISASSLTSKMFGDSEKLVRALFAAAAEAAPSIVFIDEVDSVLSARSSGEHDAMRRLKTEFLVQFDGVASAAEARVVIIGATNRPQELDDAVRRRLVKRIYIPLPDAPGRRDVLERLLAHGGAGRPVASALGEADVGRVVAMTEGYSASDLAALCKEAAMLPLRRLGSRIGSVAVDSIPPLTLADFTAALAAIRPSTNPALLQAYADFTRDFGTV